MEIRNIVEASSNSDDFSLSEDAHNAIIPNDWMVQLIVRYMQTLCGPCANLEQNRTAVQRRVANVGHALGHLLEWIYTNPVHPLEIPANV